MSRNSLAHKNMVDSQVRGWDVVDPRILDTLAAVPREPFVPEAWRSMAYTDMPIPLGEGEQMLPPVVEGRLLQALAPQPHEDVLEVGTGSGFMTACLAHLAAHVTSIDIRPAFSNQAADTLGQLKVENVRLVTGDAVREWHPQRPFHAIAVTGAVAQVPARWLDWLEPGGRLFVIHGTPPTQCASLMHQNSDGSGRSQSLFDTCTTYLKNAEPAPAFAP